MSFWKNLWKGAEIETPDQYRSIKERERAGAHDDPLPPPSPPPSCFAKGIAISLRDEPSAWKVIDGEEAFGGSTGTVCYSTGTVTNGKHVYRLDVKHNETGVRVTWVHSYESSYHSHHIYDSIVVNDKWLSEIDSNHIVSTIKAHPLGQYKVKMDTQRREEEKQAAIHSHFEALGCPPTP